MMEKSRVSTDSPKRTSQGTLIDIAAISDAHASHDDSTHNLVVKQHTMVQSLLFHLLPGIPIVLFYLLVAPPLIRLGFPPAFALCLAIPVILIPVESGILLYQGKKSTGRYSWKSVVTYRESAPVWQYIVYGLLIIAWSSLVFMFLSKPISGFLADRLFSWAPMWFVQSNAFEGSKSILLATWLMIMIFGNILGPMVEELYFRGFLLPRMARLRGWAPVVHAILFSAYHFWSPWEVVTRSIAVLPVSYCAYAKRNIYIGMMSHVLLNSLSSMALLSVIFAH